MNIDGKVHCFFEQSGTFKNEFIKLGIPAEDYDIQNNFGQTDHVIDLFNEIEHAYDDKQSIFDSITHDDLIIAFFPCIYFTGSTNTLYFKMLEYNKRNMPFKQHVELVLSRADKRNEYYKTLYKFAACCILKQIRLIIENPWCGAGNYLHNNFCQEPIVIDTNRRQRGDYFVKPTAWWFFNCEPTSGKSYQKPKIKKTVYGCKKGKQAGICSEERSMISPDYARNFICDFIIGKQQVFTQTNLFD